MVRKMVVGWEIWRWREERREEGVAGAYNVAKVRVGSHTCLGRGGLCASVVVTGGLRGCQGCRDALDQFLC